MSQVLPEQTAKEAHDRAIGRAIEATGVSAAICDRIARDLEQAAKPPVYQGADVPLLREVRPVRPSR